MNIILTFVLLLLSNRMMIQKSFGFSGIALVHVNMDDPISCKEALKGAYGAFLVTNFFDRFSLDFEVQQVSLSAVHFHRLFFLIIISAN